MNDDAVTPGSAGSASDGDAPWRYRPEFDGIRAVAVIMVIAYHYWKSAFPGGYLGVTGFFVLSGYLITGLLITEEVTTSTVDVRAFFVRRMLRLYPALVFAVIATLGAAQVFGREHAATSNLYASAVASVIFIEDVVVGVYSAFGGPLDVTWSLAVEMQFYAVWPLVLLGSRRRFGHASATHVVLVATVASAVAVGIARLLVGWKMINYTPIGSVTPLLLGGWIALSGTRIASVRPAAFAVVAVTLMLFLAPPSSAPAAFLGVEQLAAVAFALLVVSTPVPGGRLRFRASALVWVGRRSYGLYLYHLMVLFALTNAWPAAPASLRAVVGVVITVVLAASSFRWLEQPFLRGKRRFDRVATEEPSTERPATTGVVEASSAA